MEATVEDLGKLKRAITLEIPLKEIEPHYRNVYNRLRRTRLNGFRPGKFPKGWMEKRFKAVMYEEALERVLPPYLDKVITEHQLDQATQAKVSELTFERKTPLHATVQLEVKPHLDPPDYGKFLLERETPEEVKEEQMEEELNRLQKSHASLIKKDEEATAEDGDLVSITYDSTIEDEPHLPEQKIDIEIGGPSFEDFFETLRGMKAGETREMDLELPEDAEGAEKTAHYRITVHELNAIQLPEWDDELLKRFNAESLDALRSRVRENLENEELEQLQQKYRLSIRSQLTGLYDEFELPESLIEQREQNLEHEMKEHAKDLSEEDKKTRMKEGMDIFQENLRGRYILDCIAKHEKVEADPKSAAGDFIRYSSMMGESAEELIHTERGRRTYDQIVMRKNEDAVLNRVVARVFGDPVEPEVPEPEPSASHTD